MELQAIYIERGLTKDLARQVRTANECEMWSQRKSRAALPSAIKHRMWQLSYTDTADRS